ncbi:MAG: extracellular solute-binding protein, partial [Verrucomicrobiota bacterium]|nr:extracellular solute-binding protein [Verrucomicrobiota bacterium]
MKAVVVIAAGFAILLVLPVALRPHSSRNDGRTLVIITPHNEAIRYEFERAFDASHFAKTGEHVRIDWRTPGGASEIARYLASEYAGAFENYWRNSLGKAWGSVVQASFDNGRIDPATESDPIRREARARFLASNVSCGVDLLFGGGSFDFISNARAGRLVDSGFIRAHPELFNDQAIPQNFGGEPFWDANGRWVGVCLGAFGICSNQDALALLKIDPPRDWSDLADPRFFGNIALADPTQSGAAAKAFEMIIQQQMRSAASPAEGWVRAFQMIQRIAANARYFTDSGTKVPLDVGAGDAAAGMCIDFYGRFESEALRRADQSSRLVYLTPAGGSSLGADPIGLLRGAPHPDLARDFIEFALSPEGQKLWTLKAGSPGGPVKFALRRLAVRPELYASEFAPFRSDPEIQPYAHRDEFSYRPEWTGALFTTLSFVIRAAFIEPHEELQTAWRALATADFPVQPMATFSNMSAVDYA